MGRRANQPHRGAHPLLLGTGECEQRISPLAGLDLDGYNGAAPASQDVDLATAGPEVAADDGGAATAEEIGGHSLAKVGEPAPG